MMKKKYLAVTLAATMAFGIMAGAGCGNRGDATEKQESVPLVFAIDGMDGVYSPFFATAAYDSEISGQTQLGMLTTNSYIDSATGRTVAEVAYGDDYACIVKDMKTTYLDSNGASTSSTRAAQTRYEFLIKKGIKFADGEDLTIDDILFNLYVYLDPAYTGASTIYSTEIVGLEDYRNQGLGSGSDSVNDAAAPYAQARLERVSSWSIDRYIDTVLSGVESDEYKYSGMTAEQAATAAEDANYFLSLYDTELSTGYDTVESGFSEARKTYKFDAGEYWEYFLFQYGLLEYNTVGGLGLKAEKEFVTLTDPVNGDYSPAPAGTTEEDPDKGIYEVYVFDWDEEGSQNKQMKDQASQFTTDDEKREWAIDMVYETTVGQKSEQEGGLPDFDYHAFATTVVSSSSTTELYSYILTEAISELMKYQGKEITGIDSYKATSFTGDETGTYQLDSEYDVLSITIEKVDPKAIWNFAFSVAPQHYYAPTALIEQLGLDDDPDHPVINGVVFASSAFMNQVLKRNEVQRVPMGAGPYMASKRGGLGENEQYPTPGEFQAGGIVYYERNPYFDLVDGVEGGGPIQNAKIKYFRYQKINSSFMLQSLQSGAIDVGTPNATDENLDTIERVGSLSYDTTRTNGYGYVGINAGKDEVSNVWVRRAIMKAMDISMVDTYFGPNLSERIYRPMSLESWAYPPDTAGGNTPYSGTTLNNRSVNYRFDSTGDEILQMLIDAGFETEGGEVVADNNGNPLERITFTVAGETTDHPAYLVFQYAKEILERIGFEITVETNASALSELTRGGLTVWAAAWSSTVDPDMYQVYHIDSMAGSTVNWGYNEIKNNEGNKYNYELEVVRALSEQIDLGRTTLNQDERMQYYWRALDYVMELAVEFPLYQRYDLTVYNSDKIDSSTLNQQTNAYDNLFSKIWEVGYNA